MFVTEVLVQSVYLWHIPLSLFSDMSLPGYPSSAVVAFINFNHPINFVYRLILRCRQDARARFARLRSDVLVKMELLDNKHVQDVVWQLQRLVAGLADFHGDTLTLLRGNSLFPIEVDLSRSAFQYKSTSPVVQVSKQLFSFPLPFLNSHITHNSQQDADSSVLSPTQLGSPDLKEEK